jgi:DNA-binding GntR family transcriptional regulator
MVSMSLEQTPARIAKVLREQIITGELKMGSKLNEREIAERLQVSRIPVREALPILESEGFISSQPRRGAVVHVLTLTDASTCADSSNPWRRPSPHDAPPRAPMSGRCSPHSARRRALFHR